MMENVDNKIDRILIKENAAAAPRVENYKRQPMGQMQTRPALPTRTTVTTPARQLTAQDCSYYETYDMRYVSKLVPLLKKKHRYLILFCSLIIIYNNGLYLA